MIECTENYIWHKKRKKRSFKRFFSLFLVFSIVLGFYLYYKHAICEQIFKICANQAYSFSTESVNSAVLVSLNNKIEYNELIYIEKNNSGEIVFMSTNSLKVNTINRQVATATYELLKNKLNNGFNIPLGAFTGINLLSGYGTNIKLKIINTPSVVCEFVSKFTSVGINQTLHSIYIDVISTIELNMPLNSTTTTCKTQILISETVLVGKVPDIYLKDGLFN
ncbi:MAG: sporulation protein YunB [Clostridiales bacterium]|nr:sporulation protein YunB [Clostridiales bacterium]